MTETHVVYFHEREGEPRHALVTLHDLAGVYFERLALLTEGTAHVGYVSHGQGEYPLLSELQSRYPEYRSPNPHGFSIVAKVTVPAHAADTLPHLCRDLERRLGMVRV